MIMLPNKPGRVIFSGSTGNVFQSGFDCNERGDPEEGGKESFIAVFTRPGRAVTQKSQGSRRNAEKDLNLPATRLKRIGE
jgi:hypothetical protein